MCMHGLDCKFTYFWDGERRGLEVETGLGLEELGVGFGKCEGDGSSRLDLIVVLVDDVVHVLQLLTEHGLDFGTPH